MSPAAGSRIGLGTAQFGLDYGITNARGRVADEEIGRILEVAVAAGVDTVDTAHLYGESEAALGRSLRDAPLRIVTKTPKFSDAPSAAEAEARLEAAFAASLEKLGRGSVEGLLFHDPADLLGPLGPTLWAAAERIRALGRVRKLGVSIYEGAEADAALDRYPLDLVQLPWNPIDARLVAGGQLERLSRAGVEVHARSLFLQGLLLQPPEALPERFAPLREAVAALDAQFARHGLSRLEGILAAAFQRAGIARFVCGVTRAAELEEIALAARRAEALKAPLTLPTFRELDSRYLNPARWPELA